MRHPPPWALGPRRRCPPSTRSGQVTSSNCLWSQGRVLQGEAAPCLLAICLLRLHCLVVVELKTGLRPGARPASSTSTGRHSTTPPPSHDRHPPLPLQERPDRRACTWPHGQAHRCSEPADPTGRELPEALKGRPPTIAEAEITALPSQTAPPPRSAHPRSASRSAPGPSRASASWASGTWAPPLSAGPPATRKPTSSLRRPGG